MIQSKSSPKVEETIQIEKFVSKWSKENHKVVEIKYDDVGNRTFKLQGLNRLYLRHEILKV